MKNLNDLYKSTIGLISSSYYDYEKNSKDIIIPYLENMEGGVFIDCGSNAGVYSILFSLCAGKGRVICFEPTDNLNMLKNNIETLKSKGVVLDNIAIEKIAVGNKTGLFKEGIWKTWTKEKIEDEFPFTTLDDYVKKEGLTRVDFVKIDVDSFDYEVLQGSVEIMKKFSPIFLIELNEALKLRGHNKEEAGRLMKENGYKLSGTGEYGNTLWVKHK
jgi:hypothetical protein